jgi:hypothetical protein
VSSKKGWIGVDLDGTLAYHDPNQFDPAKIGPPIPRMVKLVKKLLAEGEDVRIFTARVDGGEVAISMGNMAGQLYRDVPKMKRKIERWCKKHIGVALPVTNRKDYGLKRFYDDRAVHVEFNTGKILG